MFMQTNSMLIIHETCIRFLLFYSFVNVLMIHRLITLFFFFIKKGEDKHKYGQQRAWGSFGRGLIAIVAGVSVDWFSKGLDYKNYTPIFVISLICNLLNIYVATKIEVIIIFFLFHLPILLIVLVFISFKIENYNNHSQT